MFRAKRQYVFGKKAGSFCGFMCARLLTTEYDQFPDILIRWLHKLLSFFKLLNKLISLITPAGLILQNN